MDIDAESNWKITEITSDITWNYGIISECHAIIESNKYNEYTGIEQKIEPNKYVVNEKDNIYKFLQVGVMAQNAYDEQF